MPTAPARPLPRKRAARRPKADATARTRLTPEAWIDAATDVLIDHGIDHVRVDVLAGRLQVTRGSFYWHFRDREDLLRRVLQAWRGLSTVQLTRRLEGACGDPRGQLRDVISLPFRGRAAEGQPASNWPFAPGPGATRWRKRRWMKVTQPASATTRKSFRRWVLKRPMQMRGFVLYSYEVAVAAVAAVAPGQRGGQAGAAGVCAEVGVAAGGGVGSSRLR